MFIFRSNIMVMFYNSHIYIILELMSHDLDFSSSCLVINETRCTKMYRRHAFGLKSFGQHQQTSFNEFYKLGHDINCFSAMYIYALWNIIKFCNDSTCLLAIFSQTSNYFIMLEEPTSENENLDTNFLFIWVTPSYSIFEEYLDHL